MNNNWKSLAVSPEDAVKHIGSNQNVFIHGACATPSSLIDAMSKRNDIKNVKLYHLHTTGSASFAEPSMTGHFFFCITFYGSSPKKGY